MSEGESQTPELAATRKKQFEASTTIVTDRSDIYHEKQEQLYCAIHAVNNLCQQQEDARPASSVPKVTRKEMDDIALSFNPATWFNPHRSLFGNYDANVVLLALERRGFRAVWQDRRREAKDINFDRVYGLLCNGASSGVLSMLSQQYHWFSIKQIGAYYYNLDSKLKRPERFHCLSDLINFLQYLITHRKGNVLLIYRT